MRPVAIPVGFIPLVDAAPLIVAQEMGFAAEEGIALDLRRAPSWSSLRDMLAYGQVDAAHMLAPIPVAAAMNLGGSGSALTVLSVLSINGTVIGVSSDLAIRIRQAGHDFDFADATAAGKALIAAATDRLLIGVPFPFSMHAELLYYWLSALGLPAPQGINIRTVPPPLMADALKNGEIDAFCVGEPWGSMVVESGIGALLLPGKAIWSFAPEKVLAVRSDWGDTETALSQRLIRSVWRAGRWLSDPASRILTAELLSRPDYLNVPAEIIDRALSGKLTVNPQGLQRQVPGFVEFHKEAAGVPWQKQAQWIAVQLAARAGLDRDSATKANASVFRSDLYRSALAETATDLSKAGEGIRDSVGEDSFFDGHFFDLNPTT